MKEIINQHIEEYRKQIEEHQRAIIALNGAIQALERLGQETTQEDESGDTTIRDQERD